MSGFALHSDGGWPPFAQLGRGHVAASELFISLPHRLPTARLKLTIN